MTWLTIWVLVTSLKSFYLRFRTRESTGGNRTIETSKITAASMMVFPTVQLGSATTFTASAFTGMHCPVSALQDMGPLIAFEDPPVAEPESVPPVVPVPELVVVPPDVEPLEPPVPVAH
jgi:hypothetical protein